MLEVKWLEKPQILGFLGEPDSRSQPACQIDGGVEEGGIGCEKPGWRHNMWEEPESLEGDEWRKWAVFA